MCEVVRLQFDILSYPVAQRQMGCSDIYIEGNQFAYCNRLRASDYFGLFEESGFDVCIKEVQEDKKARRSIENGFMINEKFCGYRVDDLCVTEFRVALKKNSKAISI